MQTVTVEAISLLTSKPAGEGKMAIILVWQSRMQVTKETEVMKSPIFLLMQSENWLLSTMWVGYYKVHRCHWEARFNWVATTVLTQQVLGHEADHMIHALHNHKGKNITATVLWLKYLMTVWKSCTRPYNKYSIYSSALQLHEERWQTYGTTYDR